MIVTKGISISKLIRWTAAHLLWMCLFMGGVALLYSFKIITIEIPWLPISVIGTAVAFYVGFKRDLNFFSIFHQIQNGLIFCALS